MKVMLLYSHCSCTYLVVLISDVMTDGRGTTIQQEINTSAVLGLFDTQEEGNQENQSTDEEKEKIYSFDHQVSLLKRFICAFVKCLYTFSFID